MATLAQIANELGSSPAVLAREAIIGSPASTMATTIAELGLSSSALASNSLTTLAADLARSAVQRQAEQMNAEYQAMLAGMRATIPEDLLAGMRASVSELLPPFDYRAQLATMGAALYKPAEMAASLTRELSGMYGLTDTQQARDFLEQFERDDRAWQMAKQALEGSDQWRKLLEPALIDRAIWPGPEQLADIYGQLGQPYDVSEMADILAARQAPAVISRRPEPQPPPKRLPPPQSGNFGIQPAQPGQPADWQQTLADAIKTGQAKPFEVISLVAQVATLPPPAALLAELNELEALERAWLKAKKRHTPERFAKDQGMSKATLYRRWERLKVLRWLLVARG